MKKEDSLLIQSKVLLDRQFLFIERLIAVQGQTLLAFEAATDTNEQKIEHVLDVYNYVFALIDHLARYQKIAHSVPKLSKKTIEYRRLDEALRKIKDIRNTLQHLNGHLENSFTGPLLGSICWVNNNRQYWATFHDIGRERSAKAIAFDAETGEFKTNFSFIHNDIDLERAISGSRQFHEFIRSKVKIGFGEEEYTEETKFAAFWFSIT